MLVDKSEGFANWGFWWKWERKGAFCSAKVVKIRG